MKHRLAIVAALIMAAIFALPGTGAAQSSHKSGSILEFFGFQPKPKVVVKKPSPKSVRKAPVAKPKVKKRNPGSSSPVPTISDAPAKAPDAKVVLLVGDFMAEGVSEGLASAFEMDAGVVVANRADGSSGFVRADHFDWPASISAILDEVKPSVLVVMIGTNDRQQLLVNGQKEAVLTANWTTEYKRRVTAFATTASAKNVPVVWIGLPPFKQTSMNTDMLALNDIYKNVLAGTRGQYVDIWDGFLDEQGAFAINGFDYNGQPARLRSSDGINLTAAGKRKIAFYADKPIRAALGAITQYPASAANPGFDAFALPGPKKPDLRQVVTITRIAPVSLFDPAFDGDGALLGATGQPAVALPDMPASDLYKKGIAPAAMKGRGE